MVGVGAGWEALGTWAGEALEGCIGEDGSDGLGAGQSWAEACSHLKGAGQGREGEQAGGQAGSGGGASS